MKRYKIGFLGCVILFFLFRINISCKAQQEWIQFDWFTFTSNGKHFKYGGINVPLKFDRLPYKFYAQFDLGAISVIKLDILNAFTYTLPYELRKSILYSENGNSYDVLYNLEFTLDNVKFQDKELKYVPTKSINWQNSNKPLRVGTIGADICIGKILIIDYQNQRMAFRDKLPVEYSGKINFIDCEVVFENKVIFPLKIGDELRNVLFDTGASSWELVTRKKDWKKISTQVSIDSIMGYSWGDKHYVIGSKLLPEIYMGNIKLSTDTSKCYYTNRSDIDKFYDKFNIYGIVGNAFFLNDILIIDYIHKKIGVIK